MQQRLSESDEKNHQQLAYITELETTLVDTDRLLEEVSDDILRKEQEFKYCKGKLAKNLETRVFYEEKGTPVEDVARIKNNHIRVFVMRSLHIYGYFLCARRRNLAFPAVLL